MLPIQGGEVVSALLPTSTSNHRIEKQTSRLAEDDSADPRLHSDISLQPLWQSSNQADPGCILDHNWE
ncbi:hypothetical protein KCU93_g356, partial [Aureobasidium melanogenum]